ncbi:hypothetical protein N0V94_005535 [Neodidymelliopsis sp. IMI 364377]|nr:hypothetical protein N0V94_005535 [Neodidymelliopsis sp. IMI 364377]
MAVPGPNVVQSTASHAHPSSIQGSSSSPEEHRLRRLIDRQIINVNLRGLLWNDAATVSDVLTPEIRRSPFNEEIAASHLDLTECWRGLSHSQATELLMWYKFLRTCLRTEVRATMCEDLVKGLALSEEAVDEVYLIPHMLDYLSQKRHRVINVSFVDLIDNMMGMFHDHYPNAAASMSCQWSHFPGGLSLFLKNFIRIQDCFLETPDGPCLLFDFDYTYADSVLTATGNVTWHSPDVRFLNLPYSRSVGEEYRITPFTLKDCHSNDGLPGRDDYVDQVTYTIPRSSLSFGWDPMKQCFRAVVPYYGDGDVLIDTILKATIITPFPDHVRFERQSRWNIKLDVTPAERQVAPIAPTNEALSSRACRENEVSTQTRYVSPVDKRRKRPPPATRVAQHTILQDIANACAVLQDLDKAHVMPASQKRKVSSPESVETGVDSKRRRRDSLIDSGSETAPDSSDNSEADVLAPKDSSDSDKLYFNDRPCMAGTPMAKQQSHSFSDALHSWSQCLETPTNSSSAGSAVVSSNSSAPNTTVETGYTMLILQQQQIRRNYAEFVERKRRREAGIVSPTSEGERAAFESVFLDGSELWSPTTDGSAVEVDVVMDEA